MLYSVKNELLERKTKVGAKTKQEQTEKDRKL